MSGDPFGLARFVAAQAGSYDAALQEVRQGRKRSHWMWYIFPQMKGLGRSARAEHYGIGSLEEARAYLAHPLLGPRLRTMVGALDQSGEASADVIFGSVDARKFHSSLTLFAEAGGGAPFEEALRRWFGGMADAGTLALLKPFRA